MFFRNLAVVAATVGAAVAQRPANTSICDYYTTALLKNNTAENQLTVLTLLVNTAVIGNYTQPNMGAVPGILNPNATFNGKTVNLVPYFSGGRVSTNVGGQAKAVNFLDDGGAAPLKANKPANGTSSNQYKLLTHLYSFFGAALGCTQYGMGAFPAYNGQASMYEVHKFMDLDSAEVGYFIQQVGLSAASFGVTQADITAAGKLLTDTFSQKCSPAAAVIPAQGPQLQAICIADDCPQATTGANCSAYDKAVEPATATGTATAPGSTSTGSGGSGGGSGSSGGALSGKVVSSVLVGGAVALFLAAAL